MFHGTPYFSVFLVLDHKRLISNLIVKNILFFRLFRRTDRKTRVWRKSNAKSPVLIEGLSSATPYTLFISVLDGQADPFKLTEQFQTSEGGSLFL